MKKFIPTISLVLCALGPGALRTSAQTASIVVGSGAVAAVGAQARLTATLGQGVVGLTAAAATEGGQGFWYALRPASVSVAQESGEASSPLLISGAPNPFTRFTTLSFTVPRREGVSLVLYNAIGRQVMRLLDGEYDPGVVARQVDLGDLPSGSYTAVLRIGDRRASTTLLLID